MKSSVYIFCHHLFARFFLWLFRVKIIGSENIPQEGGYLVCSNHVGNFDAFLIGASFPRPIHFLTKKEAFMIPFLHGICKMLGAIPINRGGADKEALKKCLEYLNQNELLGIFPQGHRRYNQKPEDTEIKNGVGMLAYRSKVPVLPIAIRMKNFRYRLFRPIEICIGTPIVYPFVEGSHLQQQYDDATQTYFKQVCLLCESSKFM